MLDQAERSCLLLRKHPSCLQQQQNFNTGSGKQTSNSAGMLSNQITSAPEHAHLVSHLAVLPERVKEAPPWHAQTLSESLPAAA